MADEDLTMAEPALNQGIYRQACFHSQQAVEKALKAFLLARRGTYPKSHSLEQLLLVDTGNELVDWRDRFRILDQFYLPTRYADALPEGALEDISPDDGRDAYSTAKDFVAALRGMLAA
ncbi:MAG: HEPN domain-containing protein [Candidatus Rokubacteria bacterium]|nr:HEPN domain-containing protein [Candidatus Rokubacteria bacterium]